MNKIATIARAFVIKNSLPNINEIRKTTEAELCEIKYLTPVMIESSLALPNNTGIMHNMFTSKHTHCSRRLSTLIAPKIQPNKMAI